VDFVSKDLDRREGYDDHTESSGSARAIERSRVCQQYVPLSFELLLLLSVVVVVASLWMEKCEEYC
jgi:hypothetical protein